MLWAVWCTDDDKAGEARARLSKDHSRHLDQASIRLVIAGPLTSDDGSARRGSLLVFEAETRAAVETHMTTDPFYTGGVWASTNICAFVLSRNKTIDAAR